MADLLKPIGRTMKRVMALGPYTMPGDDVDYRGDLLGVLNDANDSLAGTEEDIRDALTSIEDAQDFVKTAATGLINKHDFSTESRELIDSSPLWASDNFVRIDQAKAKAIASQMFISSNAKAGEKIVIATTGVERAITEEVVRLCVEHDVDFELDFVDPLLEAIMAKHADGPKEGVTVVDRLLKLLPEGDAELAELRKNGALDKDSLMALCWEKRVDLGGVDLEESPLEILAETRLGLYRNVGKLINISSVPSDEANKALAAVDKGKRTAYQNMLASIAKRRLSGDLHYIVTLVPTPQDAERDGMDYAKYMELYLQACEQPWNEIEKAQDFLKEKLDRANTIQITNKDGTDITLNVEGMTFANSVVGKNLPGSEVFSAPRRDGVNGKIMAKGRFKYREYGLVEDITLIFKDGKIVEFDARVGKEILAGILALDDAHGESSRYLGEIGFGTNPGLKMHSVNPLLVEKTGGSFHVAIGGSYKYTEYGGRPVNLMNGNNCPSGLHWDVTTLLRGKGGVVELEYADGEKEVVQRDGYWLGRECEVLNQGWKCFASSERPAWFNEREWPGSTKPRVDKD